jgi:choline kinase
VRVIIPAAGQGRRLLPHTTDMPKAMLPVGGVPIIERLMGQLHDAQATDVVCVVGHQAAKLKQHVQRISKRPPVAFVHNPHYARADNIMSLLATAPYWDREIAIIDSDVLVSARIVEQIVRNNGDTMVIDTSRNPETIDMAVELRDEAVWHLAKQMPPAKIGGEFFGVSRWSRASGLQLLQTMRDMVDAGTTDTWYVFAIRELAKRLRILPLYAQPDEWIEVDTADDLATANAAHQAGAAWAR